MKELTISILVPTWKRPSKIKLCLEHLMQQTVRAEEVIVVVRAEDSEGVEVVNSFMPSMPELKMVYATVPGVVNAENVAIGKASGDVVAFIDDDGYAPSDWVQKIRSFFLENQNAAGFGGSDIIKSEPWSYYDFEVYDVGIVSFFGKVTGNHHRKCLGLLREVDVLKGVNMSFRRKVLTFLDTKLSGIDGNLGNGSQWELDLCLYVKENGGQIYFDPSLVVIHDSDHSSHVKDIVAMNNAHNLSYVFSKHFKGIRYLAFLSYSLFVGNEQLPGLLKLIYDCVLKKSFSPFYLYRFKLRGFFQGLNTYWGS
jgi:glycosyltransferase involved in cell wall biosynthesis